MNVKPEMSLDTEAKEKSETRTARLLALIFGGLIVVPTSFGVIMGMAGLVGWHIHPDALIRLLS